MGYSDTKQFLKSQFENHTDKTKCTVLPMPCGTGKSSFIRELVTTKNSKPMIIVTDKIVSAQSYLKVYDDETAEYVKVKSNRVVVLTHENIAQTKPQVIYKPIVIMTFKRYFAMTVDEIKALGEYKFGKRELVIFDEKPPISESVTIGIHTFTDVFADLYNAITDAANQADKQWIVSQWEYFIDRYKMLLDEFEGYSNYPEFYFYYRDPNQSISDDDTRFADIIERYKAEITKNNFDTIQTIRKIKYMLENGAMFRCQKVGAGAGDYIKDFSFNMDNTNKIVGIGMKAFIFDATSSYTTDYDRACFEIIGDCEQFRRSLKPLTIDIVNVNTSKYALTRKTSKDIVIQAIIDEIKANNQDEAIVFTYKQMERLFSDYVRNTAHFGDIKGRNDLKSNRYYQVGLNRLPLHLYLLMLSTSEEHGYNMEYQYYFQLEPKEQIEIFHRKMQMKSLDGDIKYIAYRELLADIEQNIMRSTLRDNNNIEPVQYTLYFDTEEMFELCEAIQFRFGCMGASISMRPAPQAVLIDKIQTRKSANGKKTIAQTIIDWIKAKPEGEVFKCNQMLTELNISRKQYDKTIDNNKNLHSLMKSISVNGKRGYFRINKSLM